MQEQTAVLVQDQGEWILVTDDDEPERVWQDFDAALGELRLDGWQVAEDPGDIRSQLNDLNWT